MLTKKQAKAVADATDLVKRLSNERRRKLLPENAVVTAEFKQHGATHIRRLLKIVDQLSAVEDCKDQVLHLEAECSRFRHSRNVYQERVDFLERAARGLTTSLESTVEWLRERAVAEFLDNPGDTAVKLREVYVEVKKLLSDKPGTVNPYPWTDGGLGFQVIAPMCIRHYPKEPPPEDDDVYLLSLPEGHRLTTAQLRGAHDWLVDIGHGELNFSLFHDDVPTKVDYTLGVQVQTWFLQTLSIETTMVRAPR